MANENNHDATDMENESLDPLDDEMLEALASGREDLVDAQTLERVAADPALREQVAHARALALDVGLLLDDAHPPVDIGALVQRAIQSAPPVVEIRHLKLTGLLGLVATVVFGLLSLQRLPGWEDLARAAQLAGSFAMSTTSAIGRLPVGAGFGAACVCIALVLLLGRGFRRAAVRNALSALLAASVLSAPSLSRAQQFLGEWPGTETVSVDADNESRSAVLREAAEDSDLNLVSHLQTDPLISVRVEDVPLRAFLSVALAGEANVTVMRQDGMIVILPSDQVATETAPEAAAPERPVVPAVPVIPTAPIAPTPPVPPLPPAGDVDDRVSMGGDVHVAQGETVRDLFTMGGDALVEGVVLGDCVTMGGDVEVRGVVHGEVVSMGGDIHIYPGARVLGEVGTMGGEIINESGASIQNEFDEVEEEEHPARDFFRRASRHGVIFLLGLILLGAFQSRHARLCQAVIRSPLRAAMSGAGGFFAALVLSIALAVTIIGIPISLLVLLLTTVSVYFGFAVVASVLGALLPVPKWQGHPLKQLAAGVAILFVLSSVPVVSVFADIFAACIGFGAVVVTRFGRTEDDERA